MSIEEGWAGGKPVGTVTKRKNDAGYNVNMQCIGVTKLFSASKCGGLDRALELAEKFRMEMSDSHGKTFNKYRRVLRGDEEYLEVKAQNGIVFLCDFQHLNIVEGRHWMATSGKFPRIYAGATKKDPIRVYFHEVIMGGKCKHLNGDVLDNRTCNLELIEERYIQSPHIHKIPPGQWVGGKPMGCISRDKETYVLRFQSPYAAFVFRICDYEDEEDAFIHANDYRYEEADRRGLVKNKYRYCLDERGPYIEVVLTRGKTFTCDIEDLPLVDGYIWHLKTSARGRTFYAQASGTIRFHNLLFPYEIVDHIDGNGLNNRKYNLRDGTIVNAMNHPKRVDNKSGTTGVSFNVSKNAWIVQWSEDGKRHCKSYSIFGTRTKEHAYELACSFRDGINQRLGYHLQQRGKR